jgi:hypothetical protein
MSEVDQLDGCEGFAIDACSFFDDDHVSVK